MHRLSAPLGASHDLVHAKGDPLTLTQTYGMCDQQHPETLTHRHPPSYRGLLPRRWRHVPHHSAGTRRTARASVAVLIGKNNLSQAVKRVRSSIFGIVEHYTQSTCLIRFQFGRAPPLGCLSDADDHRASAEGGGSRHGASRRGRAAPLLDATLSASIDYGLYRALYDRAFQIFLERLTTMKEATDTGLTNGEH